MQRAFFDNTSTSRCTGSPILVSYAVQGAADCASSNSFEIDGQVTCSSGSSAGTQDYPWVSSSCSAKKGLDVTFFQRNYVIKESFMTSSTCTGDSSQGFAVAADDFCHPLVRNDGPTQFVRVNCNAGNPKWTTCLDSGCTKNCTTEDFAGEPCKLAGAMASHRVRCHIIPPSSLIPIATTVPSSDMPDVPDPISQGFTSLPNLYIILAVFLLFIKV